MTSSLGPNALDVSSDDLHHLLRGRKGAIKPFLLNQNHIAGIGNAYVHDILFKARLHPLRIIDSLTAVDIDNLANAVHDYLQLSLDKGGAFYEVNIYGEKGNFKMDDLLIGYKEGKNCPVCNTIIEKIKTGSTSSFSCPQCQTLD